MKERYVDEKTGIPYALVGDYYLPWGDFPDDDSDDRPIGVWGKRCLRFLKENRKGLYTELLTSGKLNGYLAELNEQAQGMLSRLVNEMSKSDGLTEKLKAESQMEWVGRMNNIRERALVIACTCCTVSPMCRIPSSCNVLKTFSTILTAICCILFFTG